MFLSNPAHAFRQYRQLQRAHQARWEHTQEFWRSHHGLDDQWRLYEQVMLSAWLNTGFRTLITPRTNINAMFDANPTPEFKARMTKVFEAYRHSANESQAVRDVLNGEVGRAWAARIDYVELGSGGFALRSESRECIVCETLGYVNHMQPVCRDTNDARLLSHTLVEAASVPFAHPDCLRNNDNYRYCDVSDLWFDAYSNEWGSTITGETFWYEWCVESEEVVLEIDEPNGFAFEPDEDDEDEWPYFITRRVFDNEVAQRSSSGYLPDYHCGYREWTTGRVQIPRNAIGVELELGFKDGEVGRCEFLQKYIDRRGRFKNGLPFLVERDGSLQRTVPGGLELISEPLPLRAGYLDKNSPWRQMLKLMYDNGAEAWKHRESAGLHVNVDARFVSNTDMIRYISFINNAHALSKFIAGRKQIYDGQYNRYTGRGMEQLPPRDTLLQHFANNKHAPVFFRSNQCLETRIFGANLRFEGFMACVEYCLAVMHYVGVAEPHAAFSPTASSEFRDWLGGYSRRYRYLSARLGIVKHEKGEGVPSDARVRPVLATA